jgi:hypothetical protein
LVYNSLKLFFINEAFIAVAIRKSFSASSLGLSLASSVTEAVAPVKITGKQALTKKDSNTTLIKETFCIKIIIKSITTGAIIQKKYFQSTDLI